MARAAQEADVKVIWKPQQGEFVRKKNNNYKTQQNLTTEVAESSAFWKRVVTVAVLVGGEDKEAVSLMSEVGKDGVWKSWGGQAKIHLAQDQVSSSMSMYRRSDSSYLVSQPLPTYHLGAFWLRVEKSSSVFSCKSALSL